MGKVLLDTNIVIGLLKGEDNLVQTILPITEWFLPIPVVGELIYGALNSGKPAENLEKHSQFISKTNILLANEIVADTYAHIRLQLKKKGRPIPENDIWIAATSIAYDVPLATVDKHFSHVESLTLLAIPH